jgi:hypothetical protein
LSSIRGRSLFQFLEPVPDYVESPNADSTNLVVLDASPIDDIANTQRIAMVYVRGRVVFRR